MATRLPRPEVVPEQRVRPGPTESSTWRGLPVIPTASRMAASRSTPTLRARRSRGTVSSSRSTCSSWWTDRSPWAVPPPRRGATTRGNTTWSSHRRDGPPRAMPSRRFSTLRLPSGSEQASASSRSTAPIRATPRRTRRPRHPLRLFPGARRASSMPSSERTPATRPRAFRLFRVRSATRRVTRRRRRGTRRPWPSSPTDCPSDVMPTIQSPGLRPSPRPRSWGAHRSGPTFSEWASSQTSTRLRWPDRGGSSTTFPCKVT